MMHAMPNMLQTQHAATHYNTPYCSTLQRDALEHSARKNNHFCLLVEFEFSVVGHAIP